VRRPGRCDICLGRGVINLPVYEETLAEFEPGPALLDQATPMAIRDLSRSYPCPECSKPQIPYEVGDRFTMIRANSLIQPEMSNNAGYMDSLRGGLAHRIAREMLKCGAVTFVTQQSPVGSPGYRGNGPPQVLEAVVGIVWPEGREIDRLVQDFDSAIVREMSPRGVTSGRNDYAKNPPPWDPGWRGPGSQSSDDPDVGIGVRRSQTRKPKAPIKLQKNPGRELIFEDEVRPMPDGSTKP